MRPKTAKTILWLIPGVFVLLMLALGCTRNVAFGYAAIGMVAVYGVVHQACWRCPACRKSIGPLWMKICPHCGERLN